MPAIALSDAALALFRLHVELARHLRWTIPTANRTASWSVPG